MTCMGCIYANNCIMYEPEMKACEDYTAEVVEMTNEEAIEILKSRKTCMECVMAVSSVNMCNKCNTAFDLAIKALETQAFDEALSEDGLFPVMVTKEQFAKIRELSDKGEL